MVDTWIWKIHKEICEFNFNYFQQPGLSSTCQYLAGSPGYQSTTLNLVVFSLQSLPVRQDIVQISADALGPVQIASQAFTFAWPAGQLQQPGLPGQALASEAQPWILQWSEPASGAGYWPGLCSLRLGPVQVASPAFTDASYLAFSPSEGTRQFLPTQQRVL